MRYCLILGANADTGQALAHKFAQEGYHLILAVRQITGYQERMKADLAIRYGISVTHVCFDAERYEGHAQMWDALPAMPDVVIVVFGYLGNQAKAMEDFEEAYRIIQANYIGQVSLLNHYVRRIRGQKKATIIGISSVAGERGRKSNYLYGSAKAAFSTYLSGLRNDLYVDGIHVMTVKPGFMKTRMLGDLPTPKLLTASTEYVADAIYKAFIQKKDVIYLFPIWRWIMFVIRNIPEFIFKKLTL